GLVMLNWHIGDRIRKEILRHKRGEYGKQIVENIAKELRKEFGRGYSRTMLFDMVHFTEVFPDKTIVHSLSGQLGWTHFRQIIYLKDEIQREFYSEMCRLERWSVRTLQKKMEGMLFERIGLSKKTEDLDKQELGALRDSDLLTPDLVFQDPYLLNFLGLHDNFGEKDLEVAILSEMQQFLLELGTHFSFLARQKRITVDNDDFYLDLLFYNRKLKRLVAIELKTSPLKPEYKGQMELYLRWLDKYERCDGEEAPIGLILCAGKSRPEQIELLSLDTSDIRVAEFITKELPKEVLTQKFHQAIKRAKERLTTLKESKKIDQDKNT
ncbi:MAG: PDDEXK nuclease domain-containing protein, partial [Candidatus Obscuribacterales bacterium]|nr:PDDEXK nuclease domain-containing protein [Candidatus Obscuribacterales bacterium]